MDCPRIEITAYIDGELSSADELRLATHLGACGCCAAELNEQKLFLQKLETGLRLANEIELPPDFAKIVAANAEGSVAGLRRSNEILHTAFIACALLIFILFALGPDSGQILSGGSLLLDKGAAMLGFLTHLLYSIFAACIAILRSFVLQSRIDIMLTISVVFGSFGLLRYASRRWMRLDRVTPSISR